jgi:hypothetical protein
LKDLNLTDIEKTLFNINNYNLAQYPNDRRKLIDATIKSRFICVEVGVLRGEFSEIILTCNLKKLILVDSWTNSEISGDKLYALELGKATSKDFEKWENEVREKFKNDKRVKIIKGYSIDVAKKFKDESLDWVYVDAAHHYDAVIGNLNAWMPKIKRGGYICGDDFLINSAHCFGVIEAVHEILNLDKFVTELDFKHEKYGNLQYRVIGCQFYIHKVL